MKIKITCIITICLLSSTILISCSCVTKHKITKEMKSITFIPKEFEDIELGYDKTNSNKLTPLYPDGISSNTIAINTPTKVIYKISKDSVVKPSIPLCTIYAISSKRGLKYANLSAKIIHVKELNSDIIYSGEIIPLDLQYEYPAEDPDCAEEEIERQAMILEAQNYSDDELDDFSVRRGNFMNIDVLEYVDMPIKSGKYEVYLSFSGLESNKAIVEIVIEEK